MSSTPQTTLELSRPQTISTSRYHSDARPPKALASLALDDPLRPRSLVPPRKPWMECARHRVLVIPVAFSLFSSRPASSFLLPSRQSSHNSFRVPCPRTASSFLFFPSLSASLAAPVKFRSLVRFPPPSFSTPRPHFVDFACSLSTRSPDLPDLASPIPRDSHPVPPYSPPRLSTSSPLHVSLSLPQTHGTRSGDRSAQFGSGYSIRRSPEFWGVPLSTPPGYGPS